MTVAADIPAIPAAIHEHAAALGIRVWQASTRHDRWRLGGRPYAADIDGRLAAVFDTLTEVSEWLKVQR